MPHFNLRKPSYKSGRKARRKRIVAEVRRWLTMRDAFAQLSFVDEARIRRRADREIDRKMVREGHCLLPTIGKGIAKLYLAHKYARELLETVVV